MPVVENPDGTLLIDIEHMSEVDGVRSRLGELGVPVTALVPDPDCEAGIEEVEWGELYPKIVTRNGPEPGIIVDPAQIPGGHVLLLETQPMPEPPRPRPRQWREVVQVLRLIRGPAPARYGSPRLYPARAPGELAAQLRDALDRIAALEARVSALERHQPDR